MHVGHLQGLEQQAVGAGEVSGAAAECGRMDLPPVAAHGAGEMNGVEFPEPFPGGEKTSSLACAGDIGEPVGSGERFSFTQS